MLIIPLAKLGIASLTTYFWFTQTNLQEVERPRIATNLHLFFIIAPKARDDGLHDLQKSQPIGELFLKIAEWRAFSSIK